MSETIGPVLTDEQWRNLSEDGGCRLEDFDGEVSLAFAHSKDREGRGFAIGTPKAVAGVFTADAVRAAIAVANAALPDSDPRKITRETIELLRSAIVMERWASTTDLEETGRIERLADALESYIEPAT